MTDQFLQSLFAFILPYSSLTNCNIYQQLKQMMDFHINEVKSEENEVNSDEGHSVINTTSPFSTNMVCYTKLIINYHIKFIINYFILLTKTNVNFRCSILVKI